MSKVQQVLVVPRAHLENIHRFQGFLPAGTGFLDRLLVPAAMSFMDRPAAEEDPSHKQLIPYLVVRHAGKFLAYTRGKKGSESRLHALRSIGVGGHVEPCDGPAHESLARGLERELREELHLPGIPEMRFLGLINDDSNAVRNAERMPIPSPGKAEGMYRRSPSSSARPAGTTPTRRLRKASARRCGSTRRCTRCSARPRSRPT